MIFHLIGFLKVQFIHNYVKSWEKNPKALTFYHQRKVKKILKANRK